MNAPSIAAFAKVTLSLDVRPEPYPGWHQVDLVLQRVKARDRLTFHAAAASSLEVVGGDGAPPEENLAWKALELVGRVVGDVRPVRLVLEKEIPAGAGLGGGSADAAAVLRWAVRKYPGFRRAILDNAARLGMDVPFLTGKSGRAARATGRGDDLTPLPPLSRGSLLIAFPGLALATRAVYEAFDEVGSSDPPTTPAVVDALKARVIPFRLGNQLERAAFHVAPSLAEFRSLLERKGAPPCHTVMSGSGSSYVVWFPDHGEALALARALKNARVPWVWTEQLERGGG